MKLLTYMAADQDGYLGGWIAKNGDARAWGPTEAIALAALVELIFNAKEQ